MWSGIENEYLKFPVFSNKGTPPSFFFFFFLNEDTQKHVRNLTIHLEWTRLILDLYENNWVRNCFYSAKICDDKFSGARERVC